MAEFQIAGNEDARYWLWCSLKDACEDADELASHMRVTPDELQSVQARTDALASGQAVPKDRRDAAIINLDLAKRVAERTMPELFGEEVEAAAMATVLVQALLKKAAALFLGIELTSSKSEREARSLLARKAADSRHDKPGGTRSKVEAIRAIWASGKYSTKALCAEQECAALEMSYDTARKALITPRTKS